MYTYILMPSFMKCDKLKISPGSMTLTLGVKTCRIDDLFARARAFLLFLSFTHCFLHLLEMKSPVCVYFN